MGRIARGLALLGVVLHVTLVSWHAAAQLAARHELGRLAADLAVLCHAPDSENAARAPAAPSPAERTLDCPICQGLAASHAAIAQDAPVVPPPSDRYGRVSMPSDAAALTAAVIVPRSRGPPLPA